MHIDDCSTESERDSAVLGGLVRIGSNPSGSRPNSFGRQKFAFDEVGKVDSAFCRIALLGFAIRINTLVNIDEGKNQRD